MFHPSKNDIGDPVWLHSPSPSMQFSTWQDPTAIACVVPDGELPTQLNGLDIAPYATLPQNAAHWEALADTMPIHESEFDTPTGYNKAGGAIICEPDGRVWVVAPSNAFAGYLATPLLKSEPPEIPI